MAVSNVNLRDNSSNVIIQDIESLIMKRYWTQILTRSTFTLHGITDFRARDSWALELEPRGVTLPNVT